MFRKKFLYIPFTILLITATVQLALVSRMVAFLHIQKTEIGTYHILSNITTTDTAQTGGDFHLHVLPEKLSLNQGHVTNGAAGYGVRHKSILLTLTIAVSLLVLFNLAALVYVFAVTYLTIENKINIGIARAAASAGPGVGYSIDSWTPETWYQALLLLPLESSTHSTLSAAAQEMVAWRVWIILYQIVGAVVVGWMGMAYLREWKRVCGCGCGFASGTGSGSGRVASEEAVTYRIGYAEGGRK
uniref:Uncharacterized protein n=1 Tax=Talaromyces marneffei PM1 TaxID=1077442 RepID=A0A093UZ49_TALMA